MIALNRFPFKVATAAVATAVALQSVPSFRSQRSLSPHIKTKTAVSAIWYEGECRRREWVSVWVLLYCRIVACDNCNMNALISIGVYAEKHMHNIAKLSSHMEWQRNIFFLSLGWRGRRHRRHQFWRNLQNERYPQYVHINCLNAAAPSPPPLRTQFHRRRRCLHRKQYSLTWLLDCIDFDCSSQQYRQQVAVVCTSTPF